MKENQNITKLIIIMPIVFIILTIVSNIYITINLLNNQFENDVKKAEEHELELQKVHIKTQIDGMYNYIEYKKIESLVRLKERLKDRVYTGYELAQRIYDEKKDLLSSQELQKEIIETLRKVRYGKDGYYFIAEMKSDKEITARMLPSIPNAENENIIDLKDEDGFYYVHEFTKAVTNSKDNEGFVEYKWYKLTKKEQSRKISFVKLFKEYNWFIGYGEYFEDFEENIKEEALDRFDLFKYGKNGYIFTLTTDYKILQHPFRERGIDDSNLTDIKGTKIAKTFVQKALSSNEGDYFEYYWNKPNEVDATKKIAYARLIPDWNWVVGTGVYLDDIKFSAEKIKKVKEDEISHNITKLVIISIVILIASILISLFISKRVNRIFFRYQADIKQKQNELEKANNSLEDKVKEKTKELQKLNEELEEKIQARLLEIKNKDEKLQEQSKMVALGEMIGNIAHQWRQPLSAITISASGIKLKKELDMLDDEELNRFVDGIMRNSKYLSQVIEDFKNYIKDDKVKKEFDLTHTVQKSLSIIDANIQHDRLSIVSNIDENITIFNYENELIQALVNILNNAKDALVENVDNEEERLIFIDLYKQGNKAIISIRDTAGGISDDILPKIFEPYFTTKDKNLGTGLGLYMTYKIIVDSMQGDLKVENMRVELNNKTYIGAKFEIILDLERKEESI